MADLVGRVGRAPRAVAAVDLHDPVLRPLLTTIEAVPTTFGGRPFAECGLELAKLDRVRVANRDNSNDSRFMGPVSEADIVGRVIAVWFATRDGAPDWERMGAL